MAEIAHSTLEFPPNLDFDRLQILTSGSADYETAEDPETVLRNGLVEEVHEYLQQIVKNEALDRDQLVGEVGDIVWYCSEIARHKDIRLAEAITSNPEARITLDDYQAVVAEEPIISKVIDNQGEEISFNERPQEALAVLAMRVADVMNPQNDELWNGYEHRLELPIALRDLMNCVTFIASTNEIKITEAVQNTLNKLQTRARKPHVIEKASQNDLKSSVRYRLMIDPWVRSLFFKKTK
jgi:NTP pyrophosphatase (non-canonical NTP hydrolase)